MAITDIATKESARKGGLAKGANANAARRRAEIVYRIVDGMDAEDIAPAAYAFVLEQIARAQETNVPIDSALDLMRVMAATEMAFKIGRLASGESTANVAHATMSEDERRARMLRLAAMGRAAQGDLPPPLTDA